MLIKQRAVEFPCATVQSVKRKLLVALVGSTSQQPVDLSTLRKFGRRMQVDAALLELYHGRQVNCCLYQRGGDKPSSVWWLVGAVGEPHSFGRLCKPKVAIGREA